MKFNLPICRCAAFGSYFTHLRVTVEICAASPSFVSGRLSNIGRADIGNEQRKVRNCAKSATGFYFFHFPFGWVARSSRHEQNISDLKCTAVSKQTAKWRQMGTFCCPRNVRRAPRSPWFWYSCLIWTRMRIIWSFCLQTIHLVRKIVNHSTLKLIQSKWEFGRKLHVEHEGLFTANVRIFNPQRNPRIYWIFSDFFRFFRNFRIFLFFRIFSGIFFWCTGIL